MEEGLKYKASFDINGKPLDGNKNYRLHLPPDIPASDFWSVLVYDNNTRLIIETNQPWPSVHSRSSKLFINQDGSVYVWFGPLAPPGNNKNWIQTIPGKGWNMILRLYFPLESWYNKSWRPGEIEEVK
jgi:hypothetical protein